MPAHLDLAVLMTLNVVALSLSETPQPKIPSSPSDIPFLESKDVLLQMLENKLKEIKDNKKQRDSKNGNGDAWSKNVDFKLKSNGINAVGETEILMRHGKNGQGTVNLTADGISNVGRIQLAIGLGDKGVNIPGLENIFGGLTLRSEDNDDQNQLQLTKSNEANLGFRRNAKINSDATKINISGIATEDINAKKNNDVAKAESTVSSVVTDNAVAKTNIIGAGNDQANVAITTSQGAGISSLAMGYDPAVSNVPFVTQSDNALL